MTKAQNKKYWIIGIIAAVFLYLYVQSKGGLRRLTMTNQQLAGMYRSLIADGVRTYITNDEGIEIPWQIDLASFTGDYEGVKAEYLKQFNRNLTTDLIDWFSPAELSEYVAALYKNNQQQLS
ncbi:hypothetical protein [Dyadobacter psychrotolerans]|uniref:Uncharacterized protein n=1 Tax=Dyadobacter psychrotolerans TaxID=2541721 RepID=A0A4R5DSG5_9BACT|nr:hypothetical protein [Dyadobacter psychrotolerans]TDE15294.1 hypothetical protein E0F88_12280 [Dyadobacter psychrotolerans]